MFVMLVLLVGCEGTPGERYRREWSAYRASHCHVIEREVNPVPCESCRPYIDTTDGRVYPPQTRLIECHDGKRYYESHD